MRYVVSESAERAHREPPGPVDACVDDYAEVGQVERVTRQGDLI